MRRGNHSLFIKAILSAMVLLSGSAFGATYTVSNYAQLRDKMANAKTGDIILVNPGTYAPPDVIPGVTNLSHEQGGKKRNMAPRFALINKTNITIKAANASNKPLLRGSSKTDGRYVFYAQRANGMRLENLVFENATNGVVIDRSDNIKVINNVIRNTGEEALHLRDGSDGGLIKGNNIYNVGYARKDRGEGIYICNDKKKWHPNHTQGTADDIYQKNCDNNIIEYNTVGPNIGGELIDLKEGISGTIVRHNTFKAAITDTALIAASGDYTKSLIHDKGHKSLIHNNTFDLKSMIWFDQTSTYPAIRVEQVLATNTDAGWNLYGHAGKYVYNKLVNGTAREFVVISPSYGGNGTKVGCDTQSKSTYNKYKVFSKSKSGLKIDNQEGNTGASVVSGSGCAI